MIAKTDQPPAEFIDRTSTDYYGDKSRRSHSMTEVFQESPELFQGRFISGDWQQEVTSAMDFGTVVHDVVLGPQVKRTRSNYRPRTIACFTPCDVPNRQPDTVSESGSRYWIERDRVIREADHWGQVATCYWALRSFGTQGAAYTPGERATGFCRFEHFMSSRSFLPIPRDVLNADGHKKGAKWKEFADANQDSILLKEKEFEGVPWMLEELRAHPQASKILFSKGGRNEQVVHWTCPITGEPMRSMLDRIWFAKDIIVVADYKTTGDVNPWAFGKHADDFGYMRQAAHYLRAAVQVTGETNIEFVFIAQKKTPPYTVETLVPDEESLQLADDENCRAARAIAECRRTGIWRTADYGTLKKISSPRYRFEKKENTEL